MEFLLQFLPIIIYIFLIILIVVGIILGVKLIITIDKVVKIIDDVNEKIESVTPIFSALSLASSKVGGIVEKIVAGIENLVYKLFFKSKSEKEMESEIDE